MSNQPASGWYPEPETAAGSSFFRSYLAVLYRRRWPALLVFAVVFGLLLVRSFRTIPIYEATARILIEADRPNVVAFEDIVETNRRTLDYFQTQYRLLTSRALVARALDASGLIHEPPFQAVPRAADKAWSMSPMGVMRAIVAAVRPQHVAANVEPGAADETDTAAVRRFLGSLTVTPIRNSRLVDVTFASPNPSIAQRGANALVSAFIQDAADVRNATAKDAAQFLTQMLEEQRREVEQSELVLQQSREQGTATPVEERGNIVTDRLERLNQALTAARTERIQKETAYRQLRDASGNGVQAVPLIRDNAAIQRLKGAIDDLQRQKSNLSQELTERHPTMVKLTAAIARSEQELQNEITLLTASMRTEYEAAVALERAMSSAVEQQRAEAMAMNRRGLDYGVLQRDADTNRKMYEALLKRTKEAGITEQLQASSVRVVDTASLPRSPSRPNRRLDALVGLGFGLLFALGTALGLEAIDSRIKTPVEITQRLKLPSLGMVPLLPDATAGHTPLIDGSLPQNFVEAFKALRTSVLFASAERGSRSLLVSSTAPGEGKTLVSCNLALALAMAGQRVLIIDADMRRPKVHDVFGVPASPGLSDVLVGSEPAESAINLTGHDNLRVMSAGTLPPNPPELLGSAQFTRLLQRMALHYDWILFDSPPVRAVTDGAIIANQVTSVVFVIGAEMTETDAARVALERLAGAHAKVTGAVLNRVHLHRHSYYYSRYYGRKDERYYTQPQSRRA
jgi:capsular exopolysaccharide synthesis family protein